MPSPKTDISMTPSLEGCGRLARLTWCAARSRQHDLYNLSLEVIERMRLWSRGAQHHTASLPRPRIAGRIAPTGESVGVWIPGYLDSRADCSDRQVGEAVGVWNPLAPSVVAL
jgi:hypothetical protein